MGLLVDGVWTDKWYDTTASGGRFVRSASAFRRWVTPDGGPGPGGEPGVPATTGRFLLTVSYACPWAHRTLIMRSLKGLDGMIGLSVVHWRMLENGWTFEDGPGVVPTLSTTPGARRTLAPALGEHTAEVQGREPGPPA